MADLTYPSVRQSLDSPTIGKVTSALIGAQAEFKPAVKDATNPHFNSKYVSLAGVLDAVSPALIAHRIALVQQTDVADNVTVVITRLIHESGEWLGSRYRVRPVKPDPQGEGSALTYARRYALMALVGIAPDDDDGNAASAPQAAKSPSRARPSSVTSQAARNEAAEHGPSFDVPFDEAQHDRFMTAITGAVSADGLAEVGREIAAAEMPGPSRMALRAAFSEQSAQLRKGAAK